MRNPRQRAFFLSILTVSLLVGAQVQASYTNFEVSHVDPLALTPSGSRLLALNTPDALLEVFDVQPDGSLVAAAAIPVGLEPVTVRARSDSEAWVVNNVSDSISIVDLDLGLTTRTLWVGDEPTDVVFAGGKAFVAVSQEDMLKVYDLGDLDAAPSTVPLFGRDVRALAVSSDASKVYAVVLRSGNQTTVLGVEHTFPGAIGLTFDPARLSAMNLRSIECDGPPPTYPGLPPGLVRNPSLIDPPDGIPKVGLIVRWNETAGQWQDELQQDWTHCLPYTLADDDLFVINVSDLAVSTVKGLGTSLFEVSVNPGNGKIYVPHTEARNFVRFEHPLGVTGHVLDNRMAVIDPASGNSVALIDLNTHINRASDPATNLAERVASISQPGMMVWKNGSVGFLTAIGSRKLFRVDGSCLAGSCIFGGNRAAPDAVDVGEGPTGVAFLGAAQPADERVYVLNRISHSVAVVRASDLTLLETVPLHDPSSVDTRLGRRFLYDGIDTSGHGDNSCASCHLSGDLDGLAWDLGNPEGDFVSYANLFDNVRFVVPFNGSPLVCDPAFCASHEGFDPQKGPMTTQTLRGMLEPLHWRGDRPTMNSFNPAFVGLLGKENIATLGSEPAGLSAQDMEQFRQFALEIVYPPNPFRNVNDTTPCGPRAIDPACEVQPIGSLFGGNPTEGEQMFTTHASDANQPCDSCHTLPFGAGGGKLGGVDPTEPVSNDAAAMFNGNADGSPHSDMKIPHLRNMYDKFGPVFSAPGDNSLPPTKTGFGYVHDGSIPDLFRFLSASVFTLSSTNQAQEVRDLVSAMFHFPTGTKPAVGRQVTLPQGAPPTGSSADEVLLATLMALGKLSDSNRHCELVAATVADGRLRTYHLSATDTWTTDVGGESAINTQTLRTGAQQPITFLCTPTGSGPRLGGDRDEDGVLNADDCAPADAATVAEASSVSGLVISNNAGTQLAWFDQSPTTGTSIRYDVLGGDVSALAAAGLATTACVDGDLENPSFVDTRPDPAAGDGYFYLIRAANPCGVADMGAGRESLTGLACP